MQAKSAKGDMIRLQLYYPNTRKLQLTVIYSSFQICSYTNSTLYLTRYSQGHPWLLTLHHSISAWWNYAGKAITYWAGLLLVSLGCKSTRNRVIWKAVNSANSSCCVTKDNKYCYMALDLSSLLSLRWHFVPHGKTLVEKKDGKENGIKYFSCGF